MLFIKCKGPFPIERAVAIAAVCYLYTVNLHTRGMQNVKKIFNELCVNLPAFAYPNLGYQPVKNAGNKTDARPDGFYETEYAAAVLWQRKQPLDELLLNPPPATQEQTHTQEHASQVPTQGKSVAVQFRAYNKPSREALMNEEPWPESIDSQFKEQDDALNKALNAVNTDAENFLRQAIVQAFGKGTHQVQIGFQGNGR